LGRFRRNLGGLPRSLGRAVPAPAGWRPRHPPDATCGALGGGQRLPHEIRRVVPLSSERRQVPRGRGSHPPSMAGRERTERRVTVWKAASLVRVTVGRHEEREDKPTNGQCQGNPEKDHPDRPSRQPHARYPSRLATERPATEPSLRARWRLLRRRSNGLARAVIRPLTDPVNVAPRNRQHDEQCDDQPLHRRSIGAPPRVRADSSPKGLGPANGRQRPLRGPVARHRTHGSAAVRACQGSELGPLSGAHGGVTS
jgi:hypothetical protein